ncbi:tryptophan--tRNA ligase [Thermocrispum agreste]|jgi:tryptophanyl-tRNA synthetase|uniref:Tryptophan--tRNA ligase n=1 Tax=Thermocrispum agreste TaxID=37925 RepID=A0A2W4JS21_9PSEU|nr:tryptophan--tRNA ligase [Thermocrispum agreste]PZN01202.1 MAG: tryptophan--tRNA ligase [Thermocrispum agreste]
MSQPSRKISLTGIQATGDPHLGNLVGAIRPALKLAETYETMYFIADFHAVNAVHDPQQLQHNIRSVAATWLAAGLDPSRTVFYRQSDVPEIFELNWVLSCVTGKGLMNRAHAYKAARDRNIAAGKDPDDGVNMGLFNYPVLMAADILIMEANVVPVGKDQIQHVEYAADIAGSFNALYGEKYSLTIPEALIPDAESAHTVPGLDGRKMSKSYDNTIPLFLPENKLKKLVRRIPTDSTPVEEPKDPDSSVVFQLFELFASADAVAETRKRLEEGGMGWGELKNQLFEVLNAELTPMRERYNELMASGSELDKVLAEGAERAREKASRVLKSVRSAVGIDA